MTKSRALVVSGGNPAASRASSIAPRVGSSLGHPEELEAEARRIQRDEAMRRKSMAASGVLSGSLNDSTRSQHVGGGTAGASFVGAIGPRNPKPVTKLPMDVAIVPRMKPHPAAFGSKLKRTTLIEDDGDSKPMMDNWPKQPSSADLGGAVGAVRLPALRKGFAKTLSSAVDTDSKPQLLLDLEDGLRSKLVEVNMKYPEQCAVAAPSTEAPDVVDDALALTITKRRGPSASKNQQSSTLTMRPTNLEGRQRESGHAEDDGEEGRPGSRRTSPARKTSPTRRSSPPPQIEGGHTGAVVQWSPTAARTASKPARRRVSPDSRDLENDSPIRSPQPESLSNSPRDEPRKLHPWQVEMGEGAPDRLTFEKHFADARPALDRDFTFRLDRVQVFIHAGYRFANEFKTYKKVLCWIFEELERHVAYCAENFVNKQGRYEIWNKALDEAVEQFKEDKESWTKVLEDRDATNADLEMKLQAMEIDQKKQENMIRDLKYEVKYRESQQKDDVEGRATLLKHIKRLEKELWDQRHLMEGPAKQISDLERLLSLHKEQISDLSKVNGELHKDVQLWQAKCERAENTLRVRAKPGVTNEWKREMLQFKQKENEVLEINAQMQSKIQKLEFKFKDFTETIRELKRGTRLESESVTPRPLWTRIPREYETDEMPTSSQHRVVEMWKRFKGFEKENTDLRQQVARLEAALGEMERPPDTDCETIKYVRWNHFYPVTGHDTPPYLLTSQRAANLNLTLAKTKQSLLWMWYERHLARKEKKEGTIPQFICTWIHRHFKDDRAAAMAYSLHYALDWYCFDPYVKMCRAIIRGLLDESVIVDAQSQVFQLRVRMAKMDKTKKGIITRAEAVRAVLEHFTYKEETDLRALINLIVATKTKTPEEIAQEKQLQSATPSPATSSLTPVHTGIDPSAEETTGNNLLGAVELMTSMQGGTLSGDFPAAVDQFVHNNDEERLVELNKIFAYDKINQRESPFVTEIHRQYAEYREQYMTDMVQSLVAKDIDTDPLHVQEVAETFWTVDPLIPVQAMDLLMTRLFDCPPDALFPDVETETGVKHPGCTGRRVYKCDVTLALDVMTLAGRLEQQVVRRFCKRSMVQMLLDRRAKIMKQTLEKKEALAAIKRKEEEAKANRLQELEDEDFQ